MSVSAHPSSASARLLVSAALAAVLSACGGGGASTSSASGASTGSGTDSGAGTGSTTGTDPGTTTGTDSGSGTTTDTSRVVYVVGAAAALPSGATRVATLGDVPWATLPAGSKVIVSAGSYDGVTTITAKGTQAAPITVTADDASNPPVLDNSVDFQGAAWVRVSGLTVQSPTFAGFVIRLGSNHVTVANSTVSGAPISINITDGAGTGNQLLRNHVVDSATQGINAEVNADPSDRTLISGNTVEGSGQHGIELRASHYQVEHNVVTASGQASGGTSGIHVFSGSAGEDSGDDNLVRYNYSYANVDTSAADGNGIEVDQWCDDNVVAYNVVWGNDGAGVIVYDGDGNTLEGNSAYGDGLDSGHTHVAFGELIVSASASGGATGNQVWNNLLFSTRPGVPALYVDTRALGGVNVVGANLYQNAAGGTVVRWGDGATKQTAAAIDAATGSIGSVVGSPSFADVSEPLQDGLRLTQQPSLPGLLPSGDVDMLGTAAQAGWSFFGAYFTAP